VAAKPQSAAVYRRRRLTAVAVVVGLVALVLVVVGALAGGGSSRRHGARGTAAAATPSPTPQPSQLPRGGRTLLPNFRIVAYYGAPQDTQLGALGIGTPAQAVKRLVHQAAGYGRRTRPVLPALELLADVAAGSPGEDGRYRLRQPDSVIRRYLKEARRAKALLVLDIQPGRADFFTEATRLRKWLKLPDVGLALDPEWRMDAGQVPGKVIGHVGAREVNATSAWLAQLVQRYDLPQKLFLVHEFTDGMVPQDQLKQRAGLAYVLNVDGFGTQPLKVAKYHDFVHSDRGFKHGFKLFYHEDTDTMKPAQVMRLAPRPDVIVYE
jgi:hypothetical protein